jgi:hypothetical protein
MLPFIGPWYPPCLQHCLIMLPWPVYVLCALTRRYFGQDKECYLKNQVVNDCYYSLGRQLVFMVIKEEKRAGLRQERGQTCRLLKSSEVGSSVST